MTHHRFSLPVGVAAVVLASLAFAAPASALTSAEIGCRDTIAKSTAKYAKLVFSTIARCHDERDSGDRSFSVDCNAASQADNLGKLVRARSKAISKIVGACSGASGILDQYPACPSPASSVDDGGATQNIDDFDEVARCELALVDDGVGDTTFDAMGNPQERLLDAVIRCQLGLGRGTSALMRAYYGQRRKCQRTSDSDGGAAAYSCDGTDPDGKILAAQAKLGDTVFELCNDIPEEELFKLHACSNSADGLATCSQDATDLHGSELIKDAYELPEPASTTTTTTTTTTTAPSCGSTFPLCGGDCAAGSFCTNTGTQCECVVGSGACAPATVLRHLNARYGDPYPSSVTQLSTGWTGKTHVVDVPDNSFDAVDINCDTNCDNCQISLNRRAGDPTTNCRCASNPRTPCNAVNAPDPVCGGVNPICNCYFGPGLAISSGGTPVCVLNQIREDYSGTVQFREGAYSDVIKLSSLVHLGISQTAPCPTCDGDTTFNDGVRDGTCNGGLQNGQTCDVNGDHFSFGPTSFDCPPASSTNISGTGLQIALNLSSEPQSLTAALPCDAPAGELCPCRVCSGNSQLGCTSNADCAAEGAGSCTAGGDVGIQPNACTDGICSSEGLCEAGPVDHYCDGVVHRDGRGYIACTTQADCSALNAGSCSVLDLRRCFTDPITVDGNADIYNPVTGGIFCIPATTNIAVNQTAGLPGPGTVNLDFDADVRCQSDVDQVYDFPNGDACPDVVTTTTTTTTTVTLPLPPCSSNTAPAVFPVCGGTCPGLLVCAPTLVSTCACQSAGL